MGKSDSKDAGKVTAGKIPRIRGKAKTSKPAPPTNTNRRGEKVPRPDGTRHSVDLSPPRNGRRVLEVSPPKKVNVKAQVGPKQPHPGVYDEAYAATAAASGLMGIPSIAGVRGFEAPRPAEAPPRLNPKNVKAPKTSTARLVEERAARTAEYDRRNGVPDTPGRAPTFDEYIGPAKRAAKEHLRQHNAKKGKGASTGNPTTEVTPRPTTSKIPPSSARSPKSTGRPEHTVPSKSGGPGRPSPSIGKGKSNTGASVARTGSGSLQKSLQKEAQTAHVVEKRPPIARSPQGNIVNGGNPREPLRRGQPRSQTGGTSKSPKDTQLPHRQPAQGGGRASVPSSGVGTESNISGFPGLRKHLKNAVAGAENIAKNARKKGK